MMRTKSFVLIITSVFIISSCNKKNNELVICSFGGTFQEAQRKAFFEPFEKESGIKIKEVSYSGEYSKIKAMVEAGKVEWDLVDVEYGLFLTGAKEKMFEAIDYSKVDTSELLKDAISKYGIATDFYSTGIGYRKSDSAMAPQTWIDFWDVKKIKGDRSLRKNPYPTLEIALLADGVPPDSLYPLNIVRAFNSLDKIKKKIKVWWTTGQQPVQFLSSNEVNFTSVWSGRIWNAKHINNLPLKFNYYQALLEPELWVILKGSKNKENALKFINFASKAKQQAEISKQFGVGPVNKKSFDYLDLSLIEDLPTYPTNLKKQVLINGDWWAKNQENVQDLWEKWIIK